MSDRAMVRIIPRLDIKGPNLVKGVHLEGLRVLGEPAAFARLYYEQGADELLYMDAVASLYRRNSLLDIIARTAREIFIPLTVGGGLRTLDDVRAVLNAGADKVAINTAAINRPELIREAARRFGSSTIVVSIEAIQKPNGVYECYTDNGRQPTGLGAIDWAVRATELGAGELLVTAIHQEGTGKGFDLDLTRRIAEAVPIPVIAAGGAGTIEDVARVIVDGRADAVCLASMLHFNAIKVHRLDRGFEHAGSFAYLKSSRGVAGIADASLIDIKTGLHAYGVRCRPTEEPVING